MDPTRFVAPFFGEVERSTEAGGIHVFLPQPVPRSLTLDEQTVLALSEADAALGRLAGSGRLLPNPHVLVRPYMTREALASSRIEGTQASLSEVFQAAAEGGSREDSEVREVENYIEAMEFGLRRLKEMPLCLRMLREIHGTLMSGVRGRDKRPGEFRDKQNWIGSPNDKPETAVFVPPPVSAMNEALDDLERFLNEPCPLPPLIRCALAHYQFETIHPFLDGNGRLGRLLIVFFLVQQDRLPEPLLYTSAFFEQHRREYYERLQAVRERGEIQQWLQFFLAAVTLQASDAVQRAEALSDLRERYRQELAGSTRSRAPEVIDLMLSNPIITVGLVERALGVTNQGGANLIRQLEVRGWLTPLGASGRGARRYWLAPEVFTVIEGALIEKEADSSGDVSTLGPQ